MERSKCPRKAFAPRTPPRPFPDVSEMQKVSAKANPAIGVSDPREGTGAQRRGKEDLITYRVPWKGTVPQRVRIPPGKLSLQPVAIGADDGGNDIVRSTSV